MNCALELTKGVPTDIHRVRVEQTMTGNNESEKQEKCPKCDRRAPVLVDVESSDWTDHDQICGYCIQKHSQRGWDGGGQKTACEENYDKHTPSGSGWPS